MKRLVLNAVLLLAILALILLDLALRYEPTRTNLEVLPQMAHSVRYNAFAANANFPDGKTLQAPPVGSIPRGHLPLDYAATRDDALRAGRELTSPVAPDNLRAQARGAAVFASFCTPCHGKSGLFDGPVTERGVPPPPSLLADHALKMPDGQMFHVLTYGQNNMASYAAQLSRSDRWDVIAYIRFLQAQNQPPPPAQKAGAGSAASAAGGQP